MLDGFLKKTARSIFGTGDEIDRILDEPLTGLRIDLKLARQKKEFTQPEFEAMLDKVSKVGDVGKQVDIAKKAVEARAVENELEIELDTPAKQLLWATALTRLMATSEDPVQYSTLWKQISNSLGMHNESIYISKILDRTMQNSDTTFDWGPPGTWFYHDPVKNHVNIDMYFTLLMGFVHTHAVQVHEVGHSELSEGSYTPTMKELYKKVSGQIDPRTVENPEDGEEEKKSSPKMKIDDQVAVAKEVFDWNLRHRAWNAIEDICIDRFADRMSKNYPQDFGYSLNYGAAILRGFGEVIRGDDVQVSSNMPQAMKKAISKMNSGKLSQGDIEAAKKGKIDPKLAEKMYHQLTMGALLFFYEKNGLFKGDDKSWERFRIVPDEIRQLVDVSKIPAANGKDAFDYLRQLCVGADGVRDMQPKPEDRLIGINPEDAKKRYREISRICAEKRGEIMEHIWDIYIKPFADVMTQDFQKKVEDNLKNPGKNQNKNGKPQQGQGQGQPQPGQGEGQEQKDPKGDKQKSDPNGDQKGKGNFGDEQGGGGGGEPQQQDQKDGGGGEPQDLDDDLKEQIKNMSETPNESQEKSREKNPDEKSAGQDQEKKDQEKKDAEAKAKADAEAKDKKDGQEKKEGEPGEGKPGRGWDHDKVDPTDPKKVSDMKDKNPVNEKMTDKEKEDLKEAVKNLPKGPASQNSQKGGLQRGIDYATLAKGDWRDFNQRCVELSPAINSLARIFKRIRDEQRRTTMVESQNHDFLPPDGDIFDRLDKDKMLDTRRRQLSGERLKTDDMKKFRDDRSDTKESTIEIMIMIDGSGSMPCFSLGNGTTAMETAMQSSVIVYMAARKAGIDPYILMWGGEPIVVATPEMPEKEVGQRVETLRGGTGSGTALAPGIIGAIDMLANHKNKNGTISGSSHAIIFSDGDIGDPHQSIEVMSKVAKLAKNMSIDVAVLRPPGNNHDTGMEEAFKTVIAKSGDRLVGIVRGNDAQQIPMEVARHMHMRVKKFKVTGEPDQVKRRRFKKMHNDLNK